MSSTANTKLHRIDRCQHCKETIVMVEVNGNLVWQHTTGMYSCFTNAYAEGVRYGFAWPALSLATLQEA